MVRTAYGHLRSRGERRPPRAARPQLLVLGEVAVLGMQHGQALLQRLRQRVVGGVLVGEQRVAALGRQHLRVQQRTQAGLLLVREVRVPELASITQAYVATFLDDVGHDQDFRVARQQELLEHMNLQLAEAAAEDDLLFGADPLLPEHQHMVVKVGTVNALEIFGVDWFGQVQADDLGPHGTAERRDDTGSDSGSEHH